MRRLRARAKQNKPRKQTTATIESDPEQELDADNNKVENLNFPRKVLPIRRPRVVIIDKDSPLSERLQRAPYPQQFRVGTIPKYGEEIDPRQLFINYEAAITSAAGDEVALPKVFACALEGPASTWYFSL